MHPRDILYAPQDTRDYCFFCQNAKGGWRSWGFCKLWTNRMVTAKNRQRLPCWSFLFWSKLVSCFSICLIANTSYAFRQVPSVPSVPKVSKVSPVSLSTKSRLSSRAPWHPRQGSFTCSRSPLAPKAKRPELVTRPKPVRLVPLVRRAPLAPRVPATRIPPDASEFFILAQILL